MANTGGTVALQLSDWVCVSVYFGALAGAVLLATTLQRRRARAPANDVAESDGYFLAGRSTTFFGVGASLFMSNIGDGVRVRGRGARSPVRAAVPAGALAHRAAVSAGALLGGVSAIPLGGGVADGGVDQDQCHALLGRDRAAGAAGLAGVVIAAVVAVAHGTVHHFGRPASGHLHGDPAGGRLAGGRIGALGAEPAVGGRLLGSGSHSGGRPAPPDAQRAAVAVGQPLLGGVSVAGPAVWSAGAGTVLLVHRPGGGAAGVRRQVGDARPGRLPVVRFSQDAGAVHD
eukprot:ctg_1073.g444